MTLTGSINPTYVFLMLVRECICLSVAMVSTACRLSWLTSRSTPMTSSPEPTVPTIPLRRRRSVLVAVEANVAAL